MRNLSEEEKLFLKKLVELSQKSLNVFMSNVIDDELNNVDIHLDYNNHSVAFHFDKELFDADNTSKVFEDVRRLTWKIVRYIQLLQLLEKNGMLFFFQESSTPPGRCGKLIVGHTPVVSNLSDKNSIDLILEYFGKTIIISQSLLDFVNNDFKSEDDLKHEATMKHSESSLALGRRSLLLTRIALGVSILLTLVSISITLIIGFKKSSPIEVNHSQWNQVIHAIDSVKRMDR